MRQACTDCSKRECEIWQWTIERFHVIPINVSDQLVVESEDEFSLTNESEIYGWRLIDFGVVRKTENAISEFDEFMEDYLTSQDC
jgi:hypothetical protein